MAFVLLQRPFLANSCNNHQSLPLTSLRWQQHRRTGIAVSHRNKYYISVVSCASAADDASPYESELEIVERRRRQNLGYLPSKRHVQWEHQWLDRLQDVIEFYYKEGRVPVQGGKGNEHSLAVWINSQRRAKQCLDEGKPCNNKMTTERRAMLESMSWWVWDALEAAWQSNFTELEKYVEKYDEIPPQSHPTLGYWVHTQRMAYKAREARSNGETYKYKGNNHYMDQERADKLQSLKPWSWDPLEDAWEANYQLLVEYVRQHKKMPPVSHPTLGNWVDRQRIARRAWKARSDGETDKYRNVTHYMDEERARKLEKVPGWKWDMRA